jgi:hypothetical protein
MPARRFVSDIEASLTFVHRANIQRYKKLLGTHLTDDERMFIQQRLAEEETALRQTGGFESS